jgi:hypothetical protein
VYLPLAHEPFATVPLGLFEALVVSALAIAPLLAVEAGKALVRRTRCQGPEAKATRGRERQRPVEVRR